MKKKMFPSITEVERRWGTTCPTAALLPRRQPLRHLSNQSSNKFLSYNRRLLSPRFLLASILPPCLLLLSIRMQQRQLRLLLLRRRQLQRRRRRQRQQRHLFHLDTRLKRSCHRKVALGVVELTPTSPFQHPDSFRRRLLIHLPLIRPDVRTISPCFRLVRLPLPIGNTF